MLHKFLEGSNKSHLPNSVAEYYQIDSEEEFKKNLKIQPIDWRYRNKKIEYKLNSLKYRTVEFDTVDWTNSIVMFGCSIVFGQGLSEDETLPAQLSNLLNRPVINMGVVSSSTLFSFQNSLLLNENLPTPWAVVQVWTSPDRVNYFIKNKSCQVVHCGSWLPDDFYFKAYVEPNGNAEMQSMFTIKASEAIWKNKTRYCSASFWEYEDVIKLNYIDYARDMVHPGYLTSIQSANAIARALDNKC